jgi:hypothetical protein
MTGSCQFVRNAEEAGVNYCLFLYRTVPHTNLPDFYSYSTVKYATEHFNPSVPAQYLQT